MLNTQHLILFISEKANPHAWPMFDLHSTIAFQMEPYAVATLLWLLWNILKAHPLPLRLKAIRLSRVRNSDPEDEVLWTPKCHRTYRVQPIQHHLTIYNLLQLVTLAKDRPQRLVRWKNARCGTVLFVNQPFSLRLFRASGSRFGDFSGIPLPSSHIDGPQLISS